MQIQNDEKAERGMPVEIKDLRVLLKKEGKFSFDKGWTNELHYEKRNVINLTSKGNPLGDNGVDRVDMAGIHVYFLHLKTL
ncbi:hypothetical protein SANA_30750 [Gottschalkiaceae bacterium SANA]|nr:hypothetical protein SANA_30750 [Gottschalkiaceae bacterium SANA]